MYVRMVATARLSLDTFTQIMMTIRRGAHRRSEVLKYKITIKVWVVQGAAAADDDDGKGEEDMMT